MVQFKHTSENTSSTGAKKVASPSCPANNKVNSAVFSDIALAMSVLLCLIMLINLIKNALILPGIIIIIMLLSVKLTGKRQLKAANI